jgi:hypothetical protein
MATERLNQNINKMGAYMLWLGEESEAAAGQSCFTIMVILQRGSHSKHALDLERDKPKLTEDNV